MPITSRVSHGRDASIGPVAIRYSRSVSAPYDSYMTSGETPFFRLLPILPISRVTGSPSKKYAAVALLDREGVDVDLALVLVGGGQHVALVEQAGVRLLRRQVTEVEQHLVPEAGVQQVQHGVLDAADVEVDATGMVGAHVGAGPGPVGLDRRVDERVLVGRVEVAQLVPARAGPLRHHVRVAAVHLRSVAEVERDLDPVGSGGRAGSPDWRTRRRDRTCAARTSRSRAARPAASSRAARAGCRRRRRRSGTARPSSAGG